MGSSRQVESGKSIRIVCTIYTPLCHLERAEVRSDERSLIPVVHIFPIYILFLSVYSIYRKYILYYKEIPTE
jgi:hypothetical protein